MPNDMSFLPEDYLVSRAARRTNLIMLTLFVVVILVVGGVWLATDRQRRDALAEREAMAMRFEEAAKRLEQLDELRAQKAAMERKAEVAGVLVERLQRSVILAELINNMPATMSWLTFQLDTKTLRRAQPPSTALQRAQQQQRNAAEVSNTSARPPETESNITLIGVAPTDVQVAEFISALSGHEAFVDVSLQYSEQSRMNDAVLRKFEVEMKLAPDVSVQDLDPARVPRKLKLDPMAETIQIDESGQLIVPEPSVANVPTDTGE